MQIHPFSSSEEWLVTGLQVCVFHYRPSAFTFRTDASSCFQRIYALVDGGYKIHLCFAGAGPVKQNPGKFELHLPGHVIFN